VPAFSALEAASASADVPACCKKNGAHMCSMRRGQGKHEDGKANLLAYCPFAGKGTPAVPGQRVGNLVAASVVSTPVAASSFDAKPPVFALSSTSFLANSKRGPPSVSFHS